MSQTPLDKKCGGRDMTFGYTRSVDRTYTVRPLSPHPDARDNETWGCQGLGLSSQKLMRCPKARGSLGREGHISTRDRTLIGMRQARGVFCPLPGVSVLLEVSVYPSDSLPFPCGVAKSAEAKRGDPNAPGAPLNVRGMGLGESSD